MKKLFLLLFALFMTASVSASAAETPQSIHKKMLERSYADKFDSLIIDKELSSSQLPQGMAVKSKTFFSADRFREETTTKDDAGNTANVIIIFTKDNTYLSYNAGENFYALGSAFMDKISSSLKNIEPFSEQAKLLEKTEKIGGKQCYVIEDSIEGFNTVFYIDKKNFLLLKSVSSTAEMTITTELSEYKKVEKFMTPYITKVTISQGSDEVTSTIKITSIEFNPKIEEALFAPKNVMDFPDIPGMDIKGMFDSLF